MKLHTALCFFPLKMAQNQFVKQKKRSIRITSAPTDAGDHRQAIPSSFCGSFSSEKMSDKTLVQ